MIRSVASAGVLDSYRDAELTLEDLAEAAVRLLKRLEIRPDDGRIAPAPDVRSIRYYQTIGVVDRPVRYDGRRAIYGFHHLLQLLAVKRFQQEGHPLHLIQRSLVGCPTPVLEQALGTVLSGLGPPPEPGGAAVSPSRRDVPPSRVPGSTAERIGRLASGAAREPASPVSTLQPATPTALIAARVAPGVTVTIDPVLISNPDAVLTSVAAALAPLAAGPPRTGDSPKEH
jgi:DNA-binding transcriptional MerR regulator